jgi:hypothetical protein
MNMEQVDQKDSSIIIGPEKTDIERLILKALRGRSKKPNEMVQLYKDNGISQSKYYRTLNRLIRIRKIDEINIKGNRPTEYCLTSNVEDSGILDVVIQDMVINSEPEILKLGLKKLNGLVKAKRTAWYFSEKTRIRNKESINAFFDLLNNPSSEIREKMIDILMGILSLEPVETRWRKDFKDQIIERIGKMVLTEQVIEIKKKALNLIGSLSPERSFDMSIGIICDKSLSEEQFKEMRNQFIIELFESDWARQNKVENVSKFLQFISKYKSIESMKSEEIVIYKRLFQLLEDAQFL